jgi:hypothetical protein
MSLVTLLLVPRSEHVIVTGQEPGVGRVPTFQVLLTEPLEPAVCGAFTVAFWRREAVPRALRSQASARPPSQAGPQR